MKHSEPTDRIQTYSLYNDQYEDEAYFSRQPMKKQTEDGKPSKGKKPRKKDYAEERNRKRDYE
jgi:hypothetical protein